jgi:predicted outer membrane protein
MQKGNRDPVCGIDLAATNSQQRQPEMLHRRATVTSGRCIKGGKMSSVQKIWIGTAVVLVSIGSYGARAQQASPQTAQPSEKRATQPSEKQAMQSSEKQMAQPSEKMFLTKAAMGGEAEVALATLAQRKAADPKVKALAERIEADHKKANSELRAIIAAKNITVPGGPDKDLQAVKYLLGALDGAYFVLG